MDDEVESQCTGAKLLANTQPCKGQALAGQVPDAKSGVFVGCLLCARPCVEKSRNHHHLSLELKSGLKMTNKHKEKIGFGEHDFFFSLFNCFSPSRLLSLEKYISK